jgi:hypothetical protein
VEAAHGKLSEQLKEESMENVRTRLERQQYETRYTSQAPKPKPPQDDTNDAERADRLARNAQRIREERIGAMLIDMSPDEREVTFAIIGREKPDLLGNADVIAMTLERVRAVGNNTLHEVMRGATPKEKAAVWEILKDATAEGRLGMDQGRACRAALYQVQEG